MTFNYNDDMGGLMSAPSGGERAAKIDRMDQARSDRMLARLVRDPKAPPAARIAAAEEQQKRRNTPGYVNGRGIKSAEANRFQDQETGRKFTEQGVRLSESQRPADAIEGAATNSPASPSQVPSPGGGVAPAGGAGLPKVEPSAADSPVTPPAAQGIAKNGTPAVSDSTRKLQAIKKQGAVSKFGEDLANYTNLPAAERPDADRLFEYGKTLGINEDQITAQIAKTQNKQKPSTQTKDQGSSTVANISEKYAGQGIQDGDKEAAEALRDRKGMSAQGKANSERDAASIAYGKKAVADATAAEPDVAARDKYFADKNAAIEGEYQADKDYVAQVAEDRDVWFEDVKKNSKDSTSSFGIKNAFVGYRQDAPMPEADIYGVAGKRKADPNYRPERYKSQYESKDVTDTYGVTRKSEIFTGKTKSTPIPGIPEIMTLFQNDEELDKRALKVLGRDKFDPMPWETTRDFSGGNKTVKEKKWHEKTLKESMGSNNQASIDDNLQQERLKNLTASRDRTLGLVSMNSAPI